MTLPLLVAGVGGSDLGRALGNPAGALPYTVLIDRQRAHRASASWARSDPAELRRWLDAQLADRRG
ncbi:MAG: hypothetical protein MZW92_34295 [Comamonadaceae bacterium]|nr:hypothetical protein [Comamonadaceae bacterium]